MSESEGKVGSFVGKATGLLGGALLGGATLAAGAVVGIGTAAFNASTEFEAAAAKMTSQLGLNELGAKNFDETMREVFGNNFGASIDDVAQSLVDVETAFGRIGGTQGTGELQMATEAALALRDAFGVEVAESTNAATELMMQFGISSEEAFNMITAGFQGGLNSSDDFLDTIGEYSTQFANGGATASEFFSVMSSGLAGGMLGTDKAADAFKEFSVRIADGSDTTATGLAQLGLSVDDITAGLSDGTLTTADAFNMVQGALRNTEDPVTQFQAGVALLGTQFEDLGADIASNLDTTRDWASESEGAVGSLNTQYETFGQAGGAMWRRLIVALTPFTDKLLELVNDAMPHVMAAFDSFEQNVGPAMDRVGDVIRTVVDFVKGLFQNDMAGSVTGTIDIFGTLREWFDQNMPLIQRTVETVTNAIMQAWQYIGPIITTLVTTMFGNAKIIIDTVMKTILDIITLAMQVITGDFEGAGDTLKGIVERIWGAIKDLFRNNVDGIKSILENFNLASVGRAIVNGLKDGIREKWDDLKNWWRDRIADLRDMLPFSEPKDPSSPLRGLSKHGIVAQIQKGLDQPFSSDFLRPVVAAAQGGMGVSSISLVQNFYGPTDANAVREAGKLGIMDALRQVGRR